MAAHIKEIIEKFLREKKGKLKDIAELERVVRDNLDADIKKHIYLDGVYQNKLIFYSKSPAFNYEFNLRKNQLLEKVKQVFPEIEDIKIEVR